MNYSKLQKIRKLYFNCREIARALGVKEGSSYVSATRYMKEGFLIRIKRNVYVLRDRWKSLSVEERFILANIGQVPSYISLMTALSFYEVTTQVQRDFVESIALKRTKEVEVEGMIFNYTRIGKNLYSDFVRRQDFFIATPEKAFLDAVYLTSLKRYSFDETSMDLNKLDLKRLIRLSKKYPDKTREMLKKWKI